MSDVEQWEHDEQRAMENEIISLREQVEKLTKERDDLRSRRCEVCGYLEHEREHTGCLREQLAALAEQNEKMWEALIAISIAWSSNEIYSQHFFNEALSLPDLATPVLNQIKAEAYREAAEICEKQGDRARTSTGAARALACEEAIRAKADELEKQS